MVGPNSPRIQIGLTKSWTANEKIPSVLKDREDTLVDIYIFESIYNGGAEGLGGGYGLREKFGRRNQNQTYPILTKK